MGRIEDAFARRAQSADAEHRKTLVTYLCCGDPDEAGSIDLAVACAEAGADILELGMPFSDPTADGPAIARASQRALRNTARCARRACSLRSAHRAVRLLQPALRARRGEGRRARGRRRGRRVPRRRPAHRRVPAAADTRREARAGRGSARRADQPTRPHREDRRGGEAAPGAVRLLRVDDGRDRRRGRHRRPRRGRQAGRARPRGHGAAIVRRIEEGATAEARASAVRAIVAELRAAI